MRIAIVLVAVGLAGAAVFRGAASATLDAGTKEAATLDSGSTVAVRSGFGTICGWNTAQRWVLSWETKLIAHCDNSDWFDIPGYKRTGDAELTKEGARRKLLKCRDYMYNLMHGPQGAVASAGSLLLNGALDTKQLYNDDCECYKTGPQAVRMLYAKCETLCRFGQLLHASEDIYSHSNWVDYSDPNAPISITNPPGLKQDQPMPWLDLRQPTSAVAVPQDLISGCFWLPPDFDPTSLLSVAAKKLGGYLDGNMGDCVGRVTHDVLNKDKGTIAVAKGTIVTNSDSTKRSTFATPGGNNFIRAVTVAALDTQDKWAVFQKALVDKYGPANGAKIACALSHDAPLTACY